MWTRRRHAYVACGLERTCFAARLTEYLPTEDTPAPSAPSAMAFMCPAARHAAPKTNSKDASVLGGGVNANKETQNDNDNNGDARMGLVEREFGMKLSVLLKKRSQAWRSTRSVSSLTLGGGKTAQVELEKGRL